MVRDDILRPPGFEQEVLMFKTMAGMSIGPQLHGVFPSGRLEQFIDEADILSFHDYTDVPLMQALAAKLARIHCVHLPFSKRPKDYHGHIKDIMESKWPAYVNAMLDKSPIPEADAHLETFVRSYDMLALNDWLWHCVRSTGHRVTLIHGDLNAANILIKRKTVIQEDKAEDRIVLLDYELSRYGYRGTDIGNHFRARMYDMKQMTQGKIVRMPYPSEQDRRIFVKAYLDQLKQEPGHEWDDSLDNEDQLLLEAELFGAINDLFFRAFHVKEFERLKDSFFRRFLKSMHPITFLNGMLSQLEESRTRIDDLQHRRQSQEK